MFNYDVVIALILTVLVISMGNAQEIIINEIMSDNKSYVPDDTGDFVDWIELYNVTEEDVILSDNYLSDDIDVLQKWKIPNVTISSGGYLLIYASGKNYTSSDVFHTDFKINSDGEDIFLSKGNVIADKVEVPELSEGSSYGRNPLMPGIWSVSDKPSPRELNRIFNNLDVSLSSGFYDGKQSIFVENELNHTIRFTIDGGIPNEDSPVFIQGMKIEFIDNKSNYFCNFQTSTDGGFISNPEWVMPEEKMTKGHVIRFASFDDGLRTSDIVSRSYFISEDESHNYSMPVISLIVEEADLFSDATGIYVPGADYDETNPVWSGNFFNSGDDWERPAHMTYFDKNKSMEIDQDIGIRIHGGKTRNAAQKSLRLYARSEYGKSHLEYDFLPNTNNNKYKRLILRSTMGAWGGDVIFKDEFAQHSVRDLNIYNQDYRPAILMINGEYWGVHNIRDRMDENYLAYTTGLEDDEVEIREGSNDDYNSIRDYLKNNDISDQSNYEYVSSRIDIDAFIDYNIIQMYYRNYDWPANNNKWWREKGGKWRNLMYDIDAGFDDYEYNMLEHNTSDDPEIGWPNNPGSTLFFRKLLENDQFVNAFLDRHVYLLENIFDPVRLLNILEDIKLIYIPELDDHIERWSNPESELSLNQDIEENMVEFIKHRPCIVKEQLESFFSIELDYVCPDPESVSPTNSEVAYSLFPNPTREFVTIVQSTLDCEYCDIEINNSLGALVFKRSQAHFLDNRFYLKLEPFLMSSEVYFVSISDRNGVRHTLKLVVQ